MNKSKRLRPDFSGNSRCAAAVIALASAFAIVSCATPKPVEVSHAEQLRRDQSAGLELAQRLEASVELRKDATVLKYLNELGRALSTTDPELKEFQTRVFIVSRVRGGSEPPLRGYALPGTRVYLPVKLIKSINFENELAGAVALELGHVRARTLLSRLAGKDERQPVLFGKGGAFDFSDREILNALEPAMEMLYRAGFDPRGMVPLISRYPFSKELSDALVENARRIIALHAPLRNPIVRSDRFLAIQKRMRKL